MHACKLTDKNEILHFLETDLLYAAYAVGDLEPALFAQSGWAGAKDGEQLCAIVLLFKGLDPPALFLMGDPAGLATILHRSTATALPKRGQMSDVEGEAHECLGLGPKSVFLTCQERHLEVVRAFYRTEPPTPMWRMTIQRDNFRPLHLPGVEALSPQDTSELEALYAPGRENAFTPAQLAAGVFYGVRDRERLVAAAGTHLVSPTYGMGAVGNVHTDETYRGRGYGTATTSAVVAELFRRGLQHVFLNVAQDNTRAIRVYERLGFTKYCPFVETLMVRRDS